MPCWPTRRPSAQKRSSHPRRSPTRMTMPLRRPSDPGPLATCHLLISSRAIARRCAPRSLQRRISIVTANRRRQRIRLGMCPRRLTRHCRHLIRRRRRPYQCSSSSSSSSSGPRRRSGPHRNSRCRSQHSRRRSQHNRRLRRHRQCSEPHGASSTVDAPSALGFTRAGGATGRSTRASRHAPPAAAPMASATTPRASSAPRLRRHWSRLMRRRLWTDHVQDLLLA